MIQQKQLLTLEGGMDDHSNSIANGKGVNAYMSGVQFSRLFALTFLDEHYRSKQEVPGQCEAYQAYMAKELGAVKAMSRNELTARIADLLGGYETMVQFIAGIPDGQFYFDRFYQFVPFLVPEQSFQQAMEQNPLWAATNSLVYLMAIHHFDTENGLQLKNNLYSKSATSSAMVKTMIYNMLFENIMLMDPIPSVMDGYTFDTVNDMAKKGSKAITLPSNATSC
jgi:hypothetical protein